MIDTRRETVEENWAHALSKAWELGYEVPDDADPREVGVWEIWDLVPVKQAA